MVDYADESHREAVERGDAPAATLSLTGGGQPDPLAREMSRRCTCRKMYSTRRVVEASLDALTKAAESPRTRMDWVVDRPGIRTVARLITISDRVRFEYEPFHNEVFRQLRFSAEEVERTRDGLDIRTLELPPGTGAVLRFLRPWKRMQWLHRLGFGSLLTMPSAVSVLRSGAIGVLSVAEPTVAEIVQGGRAMQRMWLATTAEGLAIQPLGSLSVFVAHVEQLHAQKLSRRHEERITDLIRRCNELIPAIKGRTTLAWFRVGYASPPKYRSLRRPVEVFYEGPEA